MPLKYIMGYLTSFIIREMEIKTLRNHFFTLPHWQESKSLITHSIGEAVEKTGMHLTLLARLQISFTLNECNLAMSIKITNAYAL